MSAGDIAQIFTAAIAVLAFGAAVWQVRSSKHAAAEALAQSEAQARQQRTIEYTSRLSDAEFMKRLARTSAALASPNDARPTEERWRAFKLLSIEEQFDIAAPLNAFEEMGTLYNLGHLDRALVDRQIAHAAQILWDRFAWWIEQAREQDSRRFCEWEQMLRDLRASPHRAA